jgi:hypothetical protein
LENGFDENLIVLSLQLAVNPARRAMTATRDKWRERISSIGRRIGRSHPTLRKGQDD